MARAMKDSGVEWIGKVPKEWAISRLKYISKISTGNKDTIHRVDNGEYPFFVRSKHIERIDMYSFDGEAILTAGDGDIGKIFHYIMGKFDYHQRVYKISNFKSSLGKFLYYYISENFLRDIEKYNAKTTVDSLRLPWLLNFPVLIPLLDEQEVIVNYLDRKCSLIDSTIEKEKEIIEKLKAYKQSIITEAVTKGLDPYVKMKPTGIDWIGEIPEGWNFIKIKYASKILRGKFTHRPRNDPRLYDGPYPFVQTGDVARAGKYIIEYSQTLNDKGYEVSRQFSSGTVVMTIAANVGDVAVLQFDACFPDSIVGFVPNKNFYWNYLYYVFVSMKKQLIRNAIISTQLNLNIEIIKEEFVPAPSQEDQKCICKHLDNKCSKIDNIITGKINLIDKLTEYKESLIYECVTGKREVV